MEKKVEGLFKVICDEYEGNLGKKASQKLFYCFEREGIDLDLRYGIHYYGPYSSKLSDEIYDLENEGIISVDTTKRTHVINWAANDSENNLLSEEDKRIALKVMNTFGKKRPLELEALSTMDFVAQNLTDDSAKRDQVIDKFIEIKGTKFSREEAKNYYTELKNLQLVWIWMDIYEREIDMIINSYR